MPSFLKRTDIESNRTAKTISRQRTRRTVGSQGDIDKRREMLFEKMQMDSEVAENNSNLGRISIADKLGNLVPEDTVEAVENIDSEEIVENTSVEFEDAMYNVSGDLQEARENDSEVELGGFDDTLRTGEVGACAGQVEKENVRKTNDCRETCFEESLIDKIRRTTENFYKDDGSNAVESLHLSCVENARDVVRDKDHLILPTYKVYINGFEKAWSAINEIRIAKGERFEIDTGVNMVLPSHTLLKIKGSPDIETKYGVRVDGNVAIRRQDAMYRITVPMVAVADLAYVSNYTGILHAYFCVSE